jgi:hypothetical protein
MPDTRVLIRDLAEEAREAKRRKLAATSFRVFEYALDKIVLPELGHLKPGACGPDRVARLIHDLEDRGLAPALPSAARVNLLARASARCDSHKPVCDAGA